MKYGVLKDYVNGKWIEQAAERPMEVFNPSTGKVLALIHNTPVNKVEEAIDAAANAFKTWSRTSCGSRMEYLFKLRNELINRREELAIAIATDQAKHITDARGRSRSSYTAY